MKKEDTYSAPMLVLVNGKLCVKRVIAPKRSK